MTAVRRMSFDEFGHAFLDLVVTDVVVSDAINSALTAPPPGSDTAAGGLVVVNYRATLAHAKVTGDPHAGFLVAIPIEMDLALGGLLTELYAIKTTVRFVLRVEAWTPLEIRIAYEPVQESSIDLDVEWKAGVPVSDWLMKNDKEQVIRKTLADEVNKALEASAAARRIDLLAMVKQSMAGGASAPAAGGSGTWENPIPLVIGKRVTGHCESIDGVHFVLDVPDQVEVNVKACLKGPFNEFVEVGVVDVDQISLDSGRIHLVQPRGDWTAKVETFEAKEARRRILRYRLLDGTATRFEYLMIVT